MFGCGEKTYYNCAYDYASSAAATVVKDGTLAIANGATWVQDTGTGYAASGLSGMNSGITNVLVGDQSKVPVENQYSAHQSLLLAGITLTGVSKFSGHFGKAYELLPLPWRSEKKFEYITMDDGTVKKGELTHVDRSISASAKHLAWSAVWGIVTVACAVGLVNQVVGAKEAAVKAATPQPKFQR